MCILRFFLKLTILLLVYTAGCVVILWPWMGYVFAVVVLVRLRMKGAEFSSHGTARWASSEELESMLE